MKTLPTFGIIWTLVLHAATLAGEGAEPPSIDELKTPSSPAFTLLGISPSSVERPSTPKAVAISLLSATAEGKDSVPENVAIEFAPYWLVSHPSLTFEEYYKPDHIGQTILRTLSLSIVTADGDEDIGAIKQEATTLGIGLRFSLVQGGPAPGLAAGVQSLKDKQLEYLKASLTNPPPAVLEGLEKEIRSAGDSVRQFDKQRVGFSLDSAGAISFRFPKKSGEQREVDRAGGWLTPAYRYGDGQSALNQFTVLGVARYLHDFRKENDYLDSGARLIWKSKQLPLALSGEYLYRHATEGGSSSRYAGVVEYVYNDNWSFFASYGKGFKNDFGEDADTIAIFGVNLGFGKGPVIK